MGTKFNAYSASFAPLVKNHKSDFWIFTLFLFLSIFCFGLFSFADIGGGAIQDAITHTMNAAEWLVGPIDSLVADARHCVLEGVDVEAEAILAL